MANDSVEDIHIIWMTTGLGCDGDSVAMTSATNPSLEDIVLGALPGMPNVYVHNPVVAFENGDEMMDWWYKAEDGEIDPFVLIVEGSIPNEEAIADTGGYWAALGTRGQKDGDGTFGQPITTNEWVDRLAPKAAAVVAIGTCATNGGIPAMKNNPTGAMGMQDYLGKDWTSKLGVPIVNIPGCPAQPDNMTETLLYLVFQLAGVSPMIPLDDQHRPKWLFNRTVHESCNRAAFYEQGDFAKEYGSHKCLVKIGCKGPIVFCNVPRRGWQNGIGGCPNVGGICMACTMPGFPDKFMPFMDESPGGKLSSNYSRFTMGPVLRFFRGVTQKRKDKEPAWRKTGTEITSGYQKEW
jgi:hydrogenase small subunit